MIKQNSVKTAMRNDPGIEAAGPKQSHDEDHAGQSQQCDRHDAMKSFHAVFHSVQIPSLDLASMI